MRIASLTSTSPDSDTGCAETDFAYLASVQCTCITQPARGAHPYVKASVACGPQERASGTCRVESSTTPELDTVSVACSRRGCHAMHDSASVDGCVRGGALSANVEVLSLSFKSCSHTHERQAMPHRVRVAIPRASDPARPCSVWQARRGAWGSTPPGAAPCCRCSVQRPDLSTCGDPTASLRHL